MAKIQAVTAAIYATAEELAIVKKVTDRFEQLNDIPVRTIVNKDLPGVYLAYPTFARYHLWRLMPPDVETVICFDYDMVPIRRLPEMPEEDLAAVASHPDQNEDIVKYWPVIKESGVTYFNSGFLVLSRKTEKLFEDVLARQTHAGKGTWPWLKDQTLITVETSIAVQRGDITFKRLPQQWNYLILNDHNAVDDPYMVHFAGAGESRMRLINLMLDRMG